MRESESPRGRGPAEAAPIVPVSRERHQARFEELAGAFKRGEFARQNEDGSVINVVSYERYIDPLDRADMSILSEFRLRAAAVGLREAFSPLVMPTAAMVSPRESVGVTYEGPDGRDRPLTFVQLGYEQPPGQTDPPAPLAPRAGPMR